MLERRAYAQMDRWRETKTRQGILITGARQVGKTTLVREYAARNYSGLAEVSFLENPRAVELVAGARNARDLLLKLSAYCGVSLTAGEALLFFDEIQEYPDILTWVKFIEEAGSVDVALSGSLLGVDLSRVRSVPVGFLHTMRMHPMTFAEFCRAVGVPNDVAGLVREAFEGRRPLDPFFHDYFMDLFYKYLLVGGMPDAVQAFVDAGDAVRTRGAQAAVLNAYRDDVTKYVGKPADRSHIMTIFDSIPNQLNKENKRFKFAKIDKSARFAHLETAFDWLENAGVALPTMRVGEPTYPLGLSADTSSFKLYQNDVGLLTSQLMPGSDIEILEHRASMNFGSVFENAVAQELFAAGHELFYYNRKGTGEVDFVLQNRMGDVSLVEVKSGKDYKRHHATSNLFGTENYSFAHAYVLHDGNVSVEGGIEYLPVYMAGLL